MSGGMPLVPDPVAEGVAGGWKVIDASRAEQDFTLEADVVIVGTGAGGGTAAEILATAGPHASCCWRKVRCERRATSG